MERPRDSTDVAAKIWLIGAPVVFTIGVLGNIITILVLIKNKKTSTTIFLTFLTCFDLAVVLTILPRWWIIYAYNIDIRQLHPYACKIHMFVVYVSTESSNMCLVAITIERIICTLMPLQIHSVCTKRLKVIVCVATCVFFCAYNSHVLYGFSVRESVQNTSQNAENVSYIIATSTYNQIGLSTPKVTEGILQKVHSNFSQNVLTLEGSTMTVSSSPADAFMAEVSTINTWSSTATETVTEEIVVVNSCGTRADNPVYFEFIKDLFDPFSIALFVMGPNVVLLVASIVIIRKISLNKLLFSQQDNIISQQLRRTAQVTTTMVTLNLAFFFFHTPIMIMYVLRFTWNHDHQNDMSQSFEIMWAVFQLMFNLNYSINFILYVFTGTRFRRQVKNLFLCRTGVKRVKDSSGQLTISISSRYYGGELRSIC